MKVKIFLSHDIFYSYSWLCVEIVEVLYFLQFFHHHKFCHTSFFKSCFISFLKVLRNTSVKSFYFFGLCLKLYQIQSKTHLRFDSLLVSWQTVGIWDGVVEVVTYFFGIHVIICNINCNHFIKKSLKTCFYGFLKIQ